MSPRQHYDALLAAVEALEGLRSTFQAERRQGDDPTGAHRKLVDALTILHSVIADLETPPHGARIES